MNKQERDALTQAALVIGKLDDALTAIGRGRNLFNVPGFQGANFVEVLKGMVSREFSREMAAPVALPVTLDPDFQHYIHDAKGQEVAQSHIKEVAVWLVGLMNGGDERARQVLAAFTRAVSATGGICTDEEGRPLSLVEASKEWPDLAYCYVKACEVLGEDPVIEPGDATYSHETPATFGRRGMTVAVRCADCKEVVPVFVSRNDPRYRSLRDTGASDGLTFAFPHCGKQQQVVVDMLWECAWCKRLFVTTEEGCPDSEGCGDANCHDCLKEHKGVCGSCHEPTEGCYEPEILPV